MLFGGICCVPSACLKKEKTIIILRKLVMMNRIDGANTSIVSTTKRFRLVTNCSGVVGALSERFTVGIASAPNKNKGDNKRNL